MRPSTAPILTAWASSTDTSSIEPPTSARSVASRSGFSSPDTIGPTTIVPFCTVTTFSDPTCTAGGDDTAGFSASALQPKQTTVRATTANATVCLIEPLPALPVMQTTPT